MACPVGLCSPKVAGRKEGWQHGREDYCVGGAICVALAGDASVSSSEDSYLAMLYLYNLMGLGG